MRNVWLVIKHEIVSTIGKPAFWLTTFVLPIVLMGFSLGAQFISINAVESEPTVMDEDAVEMDVKAIGYVDLANIIAFLPEGVPVALIKPFETESAARTAIEKGEIAKYYLIPEDYIESGELILVDSEFSLLSGSSAGGVMDYIINANLIQEDNLAFLTANPIRSLVTRGLQVEEELADVSGDTSLRFAVSLGVLFILFFVLTFSSSFMLRSVAKEKENRTVEILLVSIRPRDLMLGKVLGLGVVAILQMAIWGGGSLLVSQNAASLPFEFAQTLASSAVLPRSFYIYVIPYFVLGYIMYAALLGAIGALAPNARETGQFTFLALLPLMLPMYFNTAFLNNPHGELAVFLSLFPLTAPTSMLPRLVNGGVPGWQPLVSVALLVAATYGLVLLSAHFFRADTLLSDAALDWKRVRREFRNGNGNHT